MSGPVDVDPASGFSEVPIQYLLAKRLKDDRRSAQLEVLSIVSSDH